MENLTAEMRAGVLVEALPYLQEYYGKIVVVKYGGNAMIHEELQQAVIRDIVLLNLVGIKVVLVHGGGPEIAELLNKIGKESKFVKGLRYTDEETMDVVQMVLCGKVNKNLVTFLKNAGGKGVGLSGMDGGLFEAVRLTDEDGTEYELEVLSSLEYNGMTYLAVIPADDQEDAQAEVSILKSVEEDGEPLLCAIEDEQELETVYGLIMDQLYQDEDEE